MTPPVTYKIILGVRKMETIARLMRLGITFGYDRGIKKYYATNRDIGERIYHSTIKLLVDSIRHTWGI